MDFQVLAGDLLPAKPDYRIERLARNVAIPLNVQLITNCTTGVGSNTQICSELGVTLYYSTRAINKGDVLALSRNSRHALLAGMDMMSRQREGMLSAIIEYLHSWETGKGYATEAVVNAADIIHMFCGEEPDCLVVNDFRPYLLDERLHAIRDIESRREFTHEVLLSAAYEKRLKDAKNIFESNGYHPHVGLRCSEAVYVYKRF